MSLRQIFRIYLMAFKLRDLYANILSKMSKGISIWSSFHSEMMLNTNIADSRELTRCSRSSRQAMALSMMCLEMAQILCNYVSAILPIRCPGRVGWGNSASSDCG